jgi:hypothetical protein
MTFPPTFNPEQEWLEARRMSKDARLQDWYSQHMLEVQP